MPDLSSWQFYDSFWVKTKEMQQEYRVADLYTDVSYHIVPGKVKMRRFHLTLKAAS